MSKYCKNCGAEITSDAKYCENCGTEPGKEKATSVQSTTDQQNQISRKSTLSTGKKLAVLGILILIAVIVVAVILVLFMNGGGSGGQLVGSWNQVSGPGYETSMYTTFVFDSNGDFRMGTSGNLVRVGTWSLNGDQLTIQPIQGMTITTMVGRIVLSDGGRTLNFYQTGSSTPMVFTKQ